MCALIYGRESLNSAVELLLLWTENGPENYYKRTNKINQDPLKNMKEENYPAFGWYHDILERKSVLLHSIAAKNKIIYG